MVAAGMTGAPLVGEQAFKTGFVPTHLVWGKDAETMPQNHNASSMSCSASRKMTESCRRRADREALFPPLQLRFQGDER